MPTLFVCERDICEEPPHFGGIVVLHRCLEPFSRRQRLRELTS